MGLGDLTLGDFWSWACSDLNSNTVRSMFAEWLVGVVLDAHGVCRIEWDAVDLRYRGHTIEVKSAAYLQSWPQERPSAIRFAIGKRKPWDAATNTFGELPLRSADVYVFCLYTQRERARADPTVVADWRFWAVATRRLNTELPERKTLALSTLERLAQSVDYRHLRQAVDRQLERE